MNKAYKWEGNDLILHVNARPKSSKNEIVGFYDNTLKIKITKCPVDGQANDSLQKFLAKEFKVKPTNVIIEKGKNSKTKQIRIVSPSTLPPILKGIKL